LFYTQKRIIYFGKSLAGRKQKACKLNTSRSYKHASQNYLRIIYFNNTINKPMEIKPVRITRSRQHKQVSPNGLPIVYVGRGSKWGNPFSKNVSKINKCSCCGHIKRKKTKEINEILKETNNGIIDYAEYICELLITKFLDVQCNNILYTKEYGDVYYPGRVPQAPIWVTQDKLKHVRQFKTLSLEELRGKNLSCFCKKNKPCHADLLLKLANNFEIIPDGNQDIWLSARFVNIDKKLREENKNKTKACSNYGLPSEFFAEWSGYENK
jgi:hypothetical protein